MSSSIVVITCILTPVDRFTLERRSWQLTCVSVCLHSGVSNRTADGRRRHKESKGGWGPKSDGPGRDGEDDRTSRMEDAEEDRVGPPTGVGRKLTGGHV